MPRNRVRIGIANARSAAGSRSADQVDSARPARHGRRGNLAKSGRRFSLNASRPSCASSLM